MLEITNCRNGAILNSSHGREMEDCLLFQLEGLAHPAARISVDGGELPVIRCGKCFKVGVYLRNKFNKVTVRAISKYGEEAHTITLIWDKDSFKRYHFYIDDCVFFLTDIARTRPRRAFRHFYLDTLKKIHQEFGTKFMLNCFYHDTVHDFFIRDFPDVYKSEFEDNSHWLRLSFHSDTEMPQYAYRSCKAEKLLGEYDRVEKEIRRFAGDKSFTPAEAIHWCLFHPNLVAPLKERGVKILSGWFIDTPLLYGQSHESMRFTDLGYNTDLETALYLEESNVIYDTDLEIFFNKNNLCLNLTPLEEVVPAVKKILSNPVYHETIELYTHEQYSFPFYSHYLPDHAERIRAAVKTAQEAGYESVFFNDGLLGNEAWDKQ